MDTSKQNLINNNPEGNSKIVSESVSESSDATLIENTSNTSTESAPNAIVESTPNADSESKKVRKKYESKAKLRTKLLIGMGLTFIAIVAIVTAFIAKIYRDRLEDYYTELAIDIDQLFADEITAEDVARYYANPTHDERFDIIHKRMNDAIRDFDLTSLYVIIPHGDTYTYIIDGTDYDSEDYCESGTEDIFYGADGQELLERVMNGGAAEASVSNSAEYGYLVSVGGVIKDEKGSSVAAVITDISIDMVNSEIVTIVVNATIVATIISLISMILYYIYLHKIVISPIRRLEKAASEFPLSEDENGNLQVTKERYSSQDEIGSLFRGVIEMEQSIVVFMSNLRTATAERERIGAELSIATQIQASYLPNVFPPYPDRTDFEIFATMTPAKEVGGDFYDFFLIDDNHLCMVIADVSGKGVGAAMFMMTAKTFLNGQAHYDASPATILSDVNNRLCENNSADMFVTVWLAILDLTTGKLTASNGGHEYPFIQKAGGEFAIYKDKHSLALGAYPNVKYSEYEIQLDPGDAIFVYTDGVAEATDNNNELFGTDRTMAALNKDPSVDMDKLISNVNEGINEFIGTAPQFDDITMLALRYLG